MYRYSNGQISLSDFQQPMGKCLREDNRWVKKAQSVPWDKLEAKYADLFPSETGNVAKPLQLALVLVSSRGSTGIPMWKLFCRFRRTHICSISVGMRAMTTANCPSMRPLWCISENA